MQPQAGKKKKKHPVLNADANGVSTHIPITVKGQKYVPVPGRHSKQTHRLAAERAAAGGHASEMEHSAHDRAAMITGIAETAAEKTRHQERSKPK